MCTSYKQTPEKKAAFPAHMYMCLKAMQHIPNFRLHELTSAYNHSAVSLHPNSPRHKMTKHYKKKGTVLSFISLLASDESKAPTMTWKCYLLSNLGLNEYSQKRVLTVFPSISFLNCHKRKDKSKKNFTVFFLFSTPGELSVLFIHLAALASGDSHLFPSAFQHHFHIFFVCLFFSIWLHSTTSLFRIYFPPNRDG